MRTGVKTVVVAAIFATTAACGSNSSSPDATASGRTCTADDVKVTGTAGSKPTITIPTDCVPPTRLVTKDLVEGGDPTVKAGDTVDTQYLLVTWSDKKTVDSSWERGEPFPLQNVGQAQVIKGWNEGLIGMKQGGRRLLIVPPDKGYGATGSGGIKGGETLVFVVDAEKVTS